MITPSFALLILVISCYGYSIEKVDSDSEQYMEGFTLINLVQRTVLNNVLNPRNLTNYQTHYVIIVKVLQELTTNLVQTNQTYDEVYNVVVAKAIVRAMDNPKSVVTELTEQFDFVNTRVLKELQLVIMDICPSAVVATTSFCNLLIDNMYDKLLKYLNPWSSIKLNHLRNVFLTLRDMASMALGYDRTFKNVSENHSAVKYVVEGKEDMRPLVKNLVSFVNLLTGNITVDLDLYKRI